MPCPSLWWHPSYKRIHDCRWNLVSDLWHTVGQTPLPEEAGGKRSQSRLQDSWAPGHTVIQVISLCQGSLSRKQTQAFSGPFWFALPGLGLDISLAFCILGRDSRNLRILFFGTMNVWPGTALCMLTDFSKTAQDTKNFKRKQGPDLPVKLVIIQGQPKSGRSS